MSKVAVRTAMLVALVSSTSALAQPVIVGIQHVQRNRCSLSIATACTADDQCPAGETCVSALVTNSVGIGRDVGAGTAIGSRVFWIFGDTFTGAGIRSATAAWGRLASPVDIREAVMAGGIPYQFVPFTSDEQAFNDAHLCCGNGSCAPGTDCTVSRYALWPGQPIDLSNRSGRVFYSKVAVGPTPLDPTPWLGTGVVDVTEGSTVGTRAVDAQGNPVYVFRPEVGDRGYSPGVVVNEVDGPMVYVYANEQLGAYCAARSYVGRVPRGQETDHSAYSFWNGSGYVSAPDAAVPILTDAGYLTGVSWSSYLNTFVNVQIACSSTTFLWVRTAPRPEGPWSAATIVDLAPLGARSDANGYQSYHAFLHPEFDPGPEMLLSYYQKIPGGYGTLSQTRLIKLIFQ